MNLDDLRKIDEMNNLAPMSRIKIQAALGCSEYQGRFIKTLLDNKDLLRQFFKVSERDLGVFDCKTDNRGLVLQSPVSGDIEELLDRFNIDKKYWQVTKSVINEWGSWDNPNRQAKAWLERIGDIQDWDTFKREFIEDIITQSPVVPRIATKFLATGRMQEINIFDVHLAKLAWHEESGDNYDTKIAKKRFFEALEKLVRAGEAHRVEQILFPVGNDFYNSDNAYPYPQTTKGTPQESDIRWQRAWRIGRQILIDSIDFLKQIAPVYIPVVPGNHEYQKMFYLGDLLQVKYENDENVTIDNSPHPRKYYKWGQNLIGFTHGDKVPIPRLLGLMPHEARKMWADTKYHEWHLGHNHTGRKNVQVLENDMGGIKIKHFRTITNSDSYEVSHGYLSMGGAETLFWDKEKGLTDVAYFNL